jgi:excisionase family DNA binding protein
LSFLDDIRGATTMQEITDQRAAFSIAETATLTGVGRDQVYAAIREGKLEARKWGRRTIVPAAALQKFLTALPQLKLPTEGA